MQSGCQKESEKKARRRRAEIFEPFFRKNSLVFQLNNALQLICFPHSERNMKKRVHLGQDKGHPSCRKWGTKLSFHHEGGQLPPTAPPKSATGHRTFHQTFGLKHVIRRCLCSQQDAAEHSQRHIDENEREVLAK